jgi:hypothetical protein
MNFIKRVFFFLFNPIMYLRAKDYIPEGYYCYVIEEVIPSTNGIGFNIRTTPCPFYRVYNGMDYCLFNGTNCFMDGCKTCGINNQFPEL